MSRPVAVSPLKAGTGSALFRRRPAEPVSSLGNTWWSTDQTIDFDYHVRHSAVPQPGRIRELLQLTSRWHGALLDRHRPLWETHLVEGLADGRLAVYSKIHHSMVDGVSALKLMQRSLSADEQARGCVPPWSLPPRSRADSVDKSSFDPWGILRAAGGVAGEIAGLVPEYNPHPDGDPDPGEIVWTWVPYVENDGRGKDRPVLIIARLAPQAVAGCYLSTKRHDGFISVGSGAWDAQGRESFVNPGRILYVSDSGMRREGHVVPPERFDQAVRHIAALHGLSA